MDKPVVTGRPSLLARLLRPKILVSLSAVMVIAILVALAIPYIPWTSSGTIRFPVRVFVFDATQRTPIAEAKVTVFRSPPVLGPNSLGQEGRTYRPDGAAAVDDVVSAATDSDGMAVIDFRFHTSANNSRPLPEAHTRWAWVEVQADGYGTVVVPVRHDSMPTAEMRKLGELLVPVGLVLIEPQK